MLRTKLQKKTESSNSDTLIFKNLFIIGLRNLGCYAAEQRGVELVNCYVVG
jgi:hypothetical protein